MVRVLVRLTVGLIAGLIGGTASAQPGAWQAPYPASKPVAQGPVGPVDLIIVYKAERRMHLMRDGKVARSYKVALGKNPVGPKQRQGDGKAPEGSYEIDFRLEESSFHRALRISYPSPRDRDWATTIGSAPGGQIMIHGLPNGLNATEIRHPARDWTDGCIALTNEEMDVVWEAVSLGTRVLIFP